MNADATARRRQLGRLLRRAREAAGLTQTAVAERLGCGQAKIHKIEARLVEIKFDELEKLIKLYELSTDVAQDLRSLARLDRDAGPTRTKQPETLAVFAELTEVEPEACEIRCWHSERIPGPLQSQLYNLRQNAARLRDRKEDVTPVLREWTARGKVFTVPDPPRYRVILSESSLHRMPGGRTTQIVVDQTEHMLKLMDAHGQLEVQILPFDADIPYVDSDFEYLMFDDPTRCDFVYIEYPGAGRKCKNPHEMSECRKHWEMLSAAALDLRESREFLNKLTRRTEPSET